MQFPLLGKLNRPFPWLLGLITVGIAVVGITTYRISQNYSSKQKLEELTVAVAKQELTVEIQASGTVEPIERVKISPKTSGRLAKLLVEQGDLVTKGQILAIMDNDRLEAERLEAQANLKQAIANLDKAKITIPQEIKQAEARLNQARANLKEVKQRIPRQIEQAKAQVNSAQARLQLAEERIKRYEYLVDRGAVERDTFDREFNEFRSAQANFWEAQERLQQSQNTFNPAINQLEAAVVEAQIVLQQKQRSAADEIALVTAAKEVAAAKLRIAEVNYRDTFLSAPFDGIVTQKEATEGEIVSPSLGAGSSSIVELARGLEILAKVPEVDLSQLQVGQAVNIRADAYSDRVFQGRVKRIAPEAKVENNVTSFEVRIAIVTGQDQLRSKMNVDVTFLGEKISNALVVPTVAIVTQKGQTGVMVLDRNNKPQFKSVILGVTFDNKTQILQGLTVQDKVFINLPQEPRRKRSN